jgi:hypothetical protein
MFEIGSSLREARVRQGLDFEEMESRTKVRAKYLRALEDEQFETLPANTYVKGFLRVYADALGLDGRLYVDEYNSRFVAGEEESPLRSRRAPAARSRRRQRRESRLLALALLAIAVITALVIAAWKFGGSDEPRVRGLAGAATAKRGAAAGRATTPARRVFVEIRAVRGDSYVLVRAGSRAGRELFRGTLERGQKQPFDGPLYLSFSAPANVQVRLNGNRIALPAGGEALVTARGARAPAS